MRAVDLFAGPGGWDLGARSLGLDPLGIEWDDAACATREAASLRTLQADVAELDPADFAPCDLLIASPPCQAWSMAGKRQGQEDIERVYERTRFLAWFLADQEPEQAEPTDENWADPRSKLVTEPIRWALDLKPTYLAWEQVPPVLDYWRFCADILREEGYSVWAGVLSAERWGVPQTRKRAILMASLGGGVEPPPPTHQAFVPGASPAWEQPMSSFEGELLPWVSMAKALGWPGADLIGFPRRADDGVTTEDGYRDRDLRRADEPAFNLTENARSWTRWHYRNGNQDNAATRRADEPAPTLHFGNALNSGVEWTTGPDEPWRPEHMRDRSEYPDWPYARPATTVQGDSRIWPPGHKVNGDDIAAGRDGYGDRAGTEAVRVEPFEAAVLQAFPAAYPFCGSRTAIFRQIGNAVPPLWAAAILAPLVAAAELRGAA